MDGELTSRKIKVFDRVAYISETKKVDLSDTENVAVTKKMLRDELVQIIMQVKSLKERAFEIKGILDVLDNK